MDPITVASTTDEQSALDNTQLIDEAVGAEAVIEADSLVEEVSIDGMCGVY
ncbi:mycofactocin precursor MftA [Compostimonas suwonensis]|uniref:Mycofactocin n=1 Tax=Compostimonas suwonensis TaxID=1048394 RepID=A0A2M9BB67_9MICO|nr:mycofactocin precursor MftA [Compostimonas suwonensis]PJJ55185.1 mycofactocin precursor [Compostimonas suwonensis]